MNHASYQLSLVYTNLPKTIHFQGFNFRRNLKIRNKRLKNHTPLEYLFAGAQQGCITNRAWNTGWWSLRRTFATSARPNSSSKGQTFGDFLITFFYLADPRSPSLRTSEIRNSEKCVTSRTAFWPNFYASSSSRKHFCISKSTHCRNSTLHTSIDSLANSSANCHHHL